MRVSRPKHSKLKPEETKALLEKFNISIGQLPKIKDKDVALPADVKAGDIIKIERKNKDKKSFYYRVVVAD